MSRYDNSVFDPNSFEAIMKNNAGKNNKHVMHNLRSEMQKFVDENPDVKDIILDKSIRINSEGEVFSTHAFDKEINNFYRKFSSTLPGSLFGLRDHRLYKETPSIALMEAGNTSGLTAYEIGNETKVLRESKIAISNARTKSTDLYELTLDADDNLVFNEEALATNGILNNVQHGKRSRLFKNMIGSTRTPLNANDNPLLQILDIDQSGAPNFLEKLKAKITKGSNED